MKYSLCGYMLVTLLAAGCGEQSDSAGEAATQTEGTPGEEPLSEELAQGKVVWEANCRVCHGPGLAGAPPKGDTDAWSARIEKGVETLVQHATDGYSGPGGHQMPARGGNPDLSDAEIVAAVNYMVSQSR